MFDHVGVANSDFSASERFYRTVLGVLGVEPSYAGVDMVGWDDWWIGPADREDRVPDGRIDHLWIRVRDPWASRRFYTTIAPHAGLRLTHDEPGRVQFSGADYSFSLVCDERPPTEHVHLAFPAHENATVYAFHAAAVADGYEDHGAPGERAVYHAGYYGAFVLDPDGHNIELVNHNEN